MKRKRPEGEKNTTSSKTQKVQEKMNLIVVGSGGRESVLAWKLSQSKRCEHIFVCPGNGGTSNLRGVSNVPSVKATDIESIVKLAKEKNVGLVVVGPEQPLVEGLADALEGCGIKCFGPSAKAAEIEGSKAFSKDLMAKYGVPTAEYQNFKNFEEALKYLRSKSDASRLVIKASGIAAGKGVILPESQEEAEMALSEIMLDKRFGQAGAEVVIEERLDGEECSLLAFTDGNTVKLMPGAQDHKRIYENDKGPNTGGMGAYAPAPVLTPRLRKLALRDVLQKTVDAMKQEGRTFKGVLYAGLMISKDGRNFKVLEFNARFGDPETQVIVPLLKTDLLDVMMACATGTLKDLDIEWYDSVATTVVCASKGYPLKYPKGLEISGLDETRFGSSNVHVFQAGTRVTESGKVVTAGGRVLAVTAVAKDLRTALDRSYARVARIRFDGMQYRRDIAQRAVKRPIRLGVLGSTNGTDLQVILDSIRDGKLNAQVSCVVSNRSKSGILDRARRHNLVGAHFVSVKGKDGREGYDAAVTEILEDHGVDLVLLIGYMRIVSGAFVRRWWNRCLNVHPSLLPDFAGGMDTDVHAEVIKAKRGVSGCTVHFVTEEVDGGAIVEQLQCTVEKDETPQTLKRKVQLLEGAAMINAIRRFQSGDLDELMTSQVLTQKHQQQKTLSYADSGVDIEEGERLVSLIGPACKATRREGCDASLGGFGSLFNLSQAGYDAKDTLIVGATDGVGTKLLLAEKSGIHDTIGQDLVAMCVNDLVVGGGEPLFFLDYYATGKLENTVAARVIRGIADGCKLANCSLVGGETAEMPQMYDGSRYDLAGFAVGAVCKSELLPLSVREDDVVLGLASSGVHSNGFSLVRKIVKVTNSDYDSKPPFESSHPSLVEALLEPTRIYVKSLMKLLKTKGSRGKVRAFAHITGGGLTENIPRVLDKSVNCCLNLGSWKVLPVFEWIRKSKLVDDTEMLRTFNCGIGMVVIVSADYVKEATKLLESQGETVYKIGVCRSGEGKVSYSGSL